MNKFAVVIDYKAQFGKLDVKALEAKTLIEAMNEAEKSFTEEVYLISIAEKFGKTVKNEGAKRTQYKEVLTNRGNGWHASDDEHCENPSIWELANYGSFTDWELRIG